ncbi:MAG: hypothetical protein WBC62_05400 [Candidatus Macondimonas sp.]
MPDASQREWGFYLDDKIDFTGKVVACTDRFDLAGSVVSGPYPRRSHHAMIDPPPAGQANMRS